MWKIIKKSLDTAIISRKRFSLSMRWKFKIEFANDSFWPYRYKFAREDCYFSEWLQERWASVFPLKNKKVDNTEIFLETNDIVIAIWERWTLVWEERTFIDVINIKTEKKYRLFTKEVNLIYNEKDKIIVNAEKDWVFKTVYLDLETLEKLEEKTEWLFAFFKCVYHKEEKKWYRLDFNFLENQVESEETKYRQWYFSLKEIDVKWKPKRFNTEKLLLKTEIWEINVFEESIWFTDKKYIIKENDFENYEKIQEKGFLISWNADLSTKRVLDEKKWKKLLENINFINTQSYILSSVKVKRIIELFSNTSQLWNFKFIFLEKWKLYFLNKKDLNRVSDTHNSQWILFLSLPIILLLMWWSFSKSFREFLVAVVLTLPIFGVALFIFFRKNKSKLSNNELWEQYIWEGKRIYFSKYNDFILYYVKEDFNN